MKPDWDKLTKEYKDDSSVLIGDVDCTAEGKSLCESVSVRGFPTIKYGDPNNLEDYQGGRDLKSLQKFAKESLGPVCGPANMDLCDDDQMLVLKGFMGIPSDALQEKVDKKEADMLKADADMDTLLKSLQDQLEVAKKKKEEKVAAIKASGHGLMKSVKAHKKTTEEL